MADPATIISLVASIVTFVDFGLKVTSGTRKIRASLHGTTAEVHELNIYLEDVLTYYEPVKAQQAGGKKLSSDELRILHMVSECEKLVGALRKAINTLTIRSSSRSQTLESARVYARSFLKQGELQALQSRLDSLDTRIRKSIEHVIIRDHNSAIMERFAEIKSSQEKFDLQGESRMNLIRDDILRLTTQTLPKRDMQAASRTAELTSLVSKLLALNTEQARCAHQISVLKSLYFTGLSRRWGQIVEAAQSSNEWVFDRQKTSFVMWLESPNKDDGLFYITGKAGSGKSTLMKFIASHERTAEALQVWTGSKKLYTASFYFWNQGSELEKSGAGLFQSLLYQILKNTPDFIPLVYLDRPDYETWQMQDLHDVFDRIAKHTGMSAKFCFFVDGLDEYDGDERDVIQILETLSASNHIKICASSRPGRQYESFLWKKERTVDIAHFTTGDMKKYVSTHLEESVGWKRLLATDPTGQELVNDISVRANGVWLWVFLITRDIVLASNTNEEMRTLRIVVERFPNDLKEYFELMIKKVPDLHQDEMAQTFLVAVEEVQPLPLYAFTFLEKQREHENYALDAPIKPVLETDVEMTYPALRNRLRNRCSDLLVVDDGPHPMFLSNPVDFLHRTVREFLRDYDRQLKEHLVKPFNPLVCLSGVCLCLLKALPVKDFREPESINQVIGLTDEILYYAHEVEKRSSPEDDSPLISLLDEMDRVNCYHARHVRNHWTHARDVPSARDLDMYDEGGRCNFLALAVQARLVKYVRHKAQSNPRNLQKAGRPLLDYALRPRRKTPIRMPYHSSRDESSIDIDMVELLLYHGADPNQSVHLYGGASVWSLFLASMVERKKLSNRNNEFYVQRQDARYKACRALIRAGARSTGQLYVGGLSEFGTLLRVFGQERASLLQQELRQKERELQQSKGVSLCSVM